MTVHPDVGAGAQALWFVGKRAVELRPVDLPPLGPADVAVRTCCSGVSAGTELLAYRGELPEDLALDESIASLNGSFTYPFRYGYSAVGEIAAAGTAVDDLRPGDLVFAFHPHQSRFVVTAESVVPVHGLEPRLAVLLPYVETALQVALDAGSVLGEVVVVNGLGVLGVLVAELVQRAGAHVVAVEPQESRRHRARRLGIDAVESLDGLEPVLLAIECSGSPAALAPLLDVLAHEGTALVASWYGARPVTLPLGGSFHRRRLTIRSTQVSTIPAALSGRWSSRRRLAHALDLARSLPLADLASDTVPFEDAGEGYRRLDTGDPGVMHLAFGYQ